MKILNNWKYKRSFSNGLWIKRGVMFPWPKRKYIMLGIFGFVINFNYGSYDFN